MRLRWVGDSRDYVKWDCVFEKADGRLVFYVPMLRTKVDRDCRHAKVQEHFDKRKNLRQFEELFPGRFIVFDTEYSKEFADKYFHSVTEKLKEPRSRGVLVFIDPDTGIEPKSGANNEHLRIKDLRLVWASLLKGDKLVVYQHAPRTENWKQNLITRVAEILQVKTVPEPYSNEGIAKDVCFLVLEKFEL
jgi:hypothetical protein